MDGLEQIRVVHDIFAQSPCPLVAETVAEIFKGCNAPNRRLRVAMVLQTLASTGTARVDVDTGRYIMLKQ